MAQHGALLGDTAAGEPAATAPPGFFAEHDPRLRLVVALAGSVAAVALQTLTALLTALAIAIVALVVARPSPRAVGRRLLAVEGFMVMVLVMLPFTVPAATPERVLFTLGPLTASTDGLTQAIFILLKTNIVVLLLTALVGGLEPTRFGRALAALGLPARLVTLLLLTVRYLDVLHRDYLRLRRSMRVRGFRARVDRHSLRSIGYLVGMLLVRSVERAERILNAMRCRGFTGRFPTDGLAPPGRRDAVLAALAVLAIGACAWVDQAPW